MYMHVPVSIAKPKICNEIAKNIYIISQKAEGPRDYTLLDQSVFFAATIFGACTRPRSIRLKMKCVRGTHCAHILWSNGVFVLGASFKCIFSKIAKVDIGCQFVSR